MVMLRSSEFYVKLVVISRRNVKKNYLSGQHNTMHKFNFIMITLKKDFTASNLQFHA
jgi:hypothetical protein